MADEPKTLVEKLAQPAPEKPGGETAAKNAPANPLPASSAAAGASALGLLANRENAKTETRGRHPKGCACGNCVQSNPALRSPARAKPGAESVPLVTDIDRQLARDAIKALTLTLDSLSLLAVNIALTKKDADDETKKFALDKCAMPEATRQGMMNSGAAIAEKYGVCKLAPEAAFAIYLGQWTAQMAQLVILIMRSPDKAVEIVPDAPKN